MTKIEEIVRAWANAISKPEAETKRAAERMEICVTCEHKRDAPFGFYCGQCGCPLKAKVFTPAEPGCPIKKW